MVKRFFVIFFQSWTYEIEYKLEIIRMVFIQIITFGVPFVFWIFPVLRTFLNGFLSALCIVLLWLFWGWNMWYSVLRMVRIKKNKKIARAIRASELYSLLQLYPTVPIFLKVNGKYKIVKNNCDVKKDDAIILISIGKESLDSLYKSNE